MPVMAACPFVAVPVISTLALSFISRLSHTAQPFLFSIFTGPLLVMVVPYGKYLPKLVLSQFAMIVTLPWPAELSTSSLPSTAPSLLFWRFTSPVQSTIFNDPRNPMLEPVAGVTVTFFMPVMVRPILLGLLVSVTQFVPAVHSSKL